ncbi:MAG: hypothetical protein R6V49_02305 [Bacteroidales bacterium]
MNLKQKRDLYRSIIADISTSQLVSALTGLRELAQQTGSEAEIVELDQEALIYNQVLRYFILKAPDPQRVEVKERLRMKLFHMGDVLFARSLSDQPKNHFYIARRKYDRETEIKLQDLKALEKMLGNLETENQEEVELKMERYFYSLWMSSTLSPAPLEACRSWLMNEKCSAGLGSVLVSALVLHLLEKFSPVVWMLLADIYLDKRNQLWQRALLGMVISIVRFDHRINLFPEITQRLTLLAEHDFFAEDLERVAIQLVRTADTEKVTKKIQEEILPEMMKLAPKIQEKLSLDQFLQDETGEEKNPEWEEFFQDSPEIYQKIEELNKLQSEGVDLFINTFSRLKHFPFFQSTVNWFLPYSPHHPALKPRHDENGTEPTDMVEFFEVFASFPVMCNSDKYSFSFNLLEMQEEQKRMIMSALSGEMREMNRLSDDEAVLSNTTGYEVFHQYAQDLYRFFRIHPGYAETEDPFAMRKQLYQCQAMKGLLEELPGLTRRIAEYYFQQGHYRHAINLFEMLETAPQDSPELFQKLAYAWQMETNLDKALAYYRKAELFDSNALWNLRKIAWCHHLKGEPAEALKAYREAELLDPASVQIKLNIGNLLLEEEDWEEALHYYLKAEELQPGKERTLRPVAWCLFLQGELETSSYYYDQIMELNFNHNDLLNYAHVKLALNERDAALNLYRQSLNHRKNTPASFREAFSNDRGHLERLGVAAADIAFMFDAVLAADDHAD